ncbi:hypothetical protein PG994_007154 [Apiospora phragmitis]|uniref:Uncharacterized protein n=1 Tax=Apiospora phragmitis TaxID=2905665 RepID=A0ABR1UZZ2_9PEZI
MNGGVSNIKDDTPTQGKPGIPCLRVLKRGARTGFSLGVTNSVEACVRTERAHELTDGETCSRQLLVVPFPGQVFRGSKHTGGGRCCFSHAGDSGAAVMDATGVFVGQVLAGSGPMVAVNYPDHSDMLECRYADIDLTFVQPAGALMADVERCLGKKHTLLLDVSNKVA